MNSRDVIGLREAYQQIYEPVITEDFIIESLDSFGYWINNLLEEGYNLDEFTIDELIDIYEDNVGPMGQGVGRAIRSGVGQLASGIKDVGGAYLQGFLGQDTTSKNPLARFVNMGTRNLTAVPRFGVGVVQGLMGQGGGQKPTTSAAQTKPKAPTGSGTPTPKPPSGSPAPTPRPSSGSGTATPPRTPTSPKPPATPSSSSTGSGDALSQWAKANRSMIQSSGTQAQRDILAKADAGQSQQRMTPLIQKPINQNVSNASDDTQTTKKLTNPKTSLPSLDTASYNYGNRNVVNERWTAEGPSKGSKPGDFGTPSSVAAAYRAGGGDAAAKQRGLSGPQVVAQGTQNLQRAYKAGGGDALARKFDDPRESSKRYVTQLGLKNLAQQRSSASTTPPSTPSPTLRPSTSITRPSAPQATAQVSKPVATSTKPSIEPTAPPVPMPKLGTGSGESIFSKGTSLSPEQGREAFKKQLSPSSSSQQNVSNSYEYDAYDLVLEYLISSGQADSESEANYIMLEMDMDTIKGILDLYESYEDFDYNELDSYYEEFIEESLDALYEEGFSTEEICSLTEEEFAEVFSIIDEAMLKDLGKSAVRALSRHAKKRARELGHDVPDTLSDKKGRKLTGSALQSTERAVKQTRAAQKPASEWEKFTSQIDKDAERQKEAKRRRESKVGGFTPIEKKDFKGRKITAPERVMKDTDDFQSKAAMSRTIGDLRAQYKTEKSEKSEPKKVPAPSFTGRLESMIRNSQAQKQEKSQPETKKEPETRKERLARLSASMGATKQERKETRRQRQAEREKQRGSASVAKNRLLSMKEGAMDSGPGGWGNLGRTTPRNAPPRNPDNNLNLRGRTTPQRELPATPSSSPQNRGFDTGKNSWGSLGKGPKSKTPDTFGNYQPQSKPLY